MDVRLIQIDQQVLVALRAGQHIPEPLDKGLPLLRVGPSQRLLGFLPRQLAAVQNRADRLATAHQASTPGRSARGPSRPGGARSSVARGRPLLWVGWPPFAGP